MAESPKRRTDHSQADTSRSQLDSSRATKPVRPPGSPSTETARAADSVPIAVGPFTDLPMRFGRYKILKELGRGQMGAVYLAQDTELDRPVALKVARTSLSGSAKLLKRMEVEAKAAAKIDHPLICKVYDAGEIDGIRFIALQYIEGEDLKQLMKRLGRKREPAEAIRLVLQILRALAAAHEKGVIHRDLKPENVMLNKKNEPVIMDFGLARRAIASADAGLTQGMVVGTAAYMSPEQATGKADGIDHRSDLYAVGVMLFEMLTGEWPFTGGAIEVMGKKSCQEPPTPLSLNPNLHPQLAAVCHKMIAKQKEDRYATCAEMIAALDGVYTNTNSRNSHSTTTRRVLQSNKVELSRLFDFPVDSSANSALHKSTKSTAVKATPPKKALPVVLTLLLNSWNTLPPTRIWTMATGVAVCLLALLTAFAYFTSKQQELGTKLTAASGNTTAPTQQLRLLVDEKLVDEPVGPTIDLIQSVDLSRDSFAGEWAKEGASLIGGRNSRLYLPIKAPADYQLKLIANRIAGDGMLLVGFVMDGRQGVAAFDGYKSQFSGMYLDGRSPKENCTARPGALFKNDQPYTIVVTVHPGHFHASVDGITIVNWHGDANRLYVPSDQGIPNRETPFVGVGQERYRIDSAVMIPIKQELQTQRISKVESSVDLIPVLDADRDAVSGVWSIINERLQSPISGPGKFSLPIAAPDEYTLTATVELPVDAQGETSFVIGLIASNSTCAIQLQNGYCAGLGLIDGARWDANETRLAGSFFKKGEPVKVACTVTKQAVRMEIGGRTLIHWSGSFHRLTPQPDWIPSDARKLFFGTTTHFKFSDIKLGPPIDPPSLPEHPPLAIGRPVDLLSLIDPARDALTGKWQRDGNVLRVMGDVQASKLMIPFEVPSEYKLKIKVAREVGGGSNNVCLNVRLPIDSSMAELSLDDTGSQFSGVHLDNLSLNDNRNFTSRIGNSIPIGTSHEFIAYISKTSLKVVVGDKTIIDWIGNPNRYSRTLAWGAPDGRIVISSWDSRFRFEKIEIEPFGPSSFSPVPKLGGDGNLVSIVDVQRDSRQGQWTKIADGLLSPAFATNRLRIPVTPPDRYVLSMDVERRKGTSHICLGLVISGQPCIATLDCGNQSGLENVDGKPLLDRLNPTRRSHPEPLLPHHKRIQVRCYVTPDKIVIKCGENEVVRWNGDPRRLSLNPVYQPPNYAEMDRSNLWIGGWDSEFLFRDIRLTPFSDDELKKLTVDSAAVL